jgi:hypothetical protein
MFHMVGITPEANSLADAFHGAVPDQAVRISAGEVSAFTTV